MNNLEQTHGIGNPITSENQDFENKNNTQNPTIDEGTDSNCPPVENTEIEKTTEKSDENQEKQIKVETDSNETEHKTENDLIAAHDDDDDLDEETEIEDLSNCTKVDLVAKIKSAIENSPIEKINNIVEYIRTRYNQLTEEENEVINIKQIDEDGEEDAETQDLNISENPLDKEFYTILESYKTNLRLFREQQEKDKETNLKRKYAIIEAIEQLINTDEPANKAFNEFRQLQEEWRNIGLVPQSATKHLYETYHHHIERFYDYIKIHKELYELDLKKNLELKNELCEKVEALITELSITKAFKALQEFHKQWREIGPTARDKKEEVWERFKSATAKINQRHHDHYVQLREEQEKNLEQKRTLCNKLKEINKLTLVKPKRWEEKAAEIIEIQKLWKSIGFAPRKENNELFELFKSECDLFFKAKRNFFDNRRKEEQNNMQMKLDLCAQAEALKDSTEWKKTTEDFIKLQKAWKEIGVIPHKHSEIIWQRFRSTCDAFFNAKAAHFGGLDKAQEDNLNSKIALIEQVQQFKLTGNNEEDLKTLSNFQTEWTEIGFVPFDQKDKIQKEFRRALDEHFNKLNVSPRQNTEKYKTLLKTWKENPKTKSKVSSERNKIVLKIREVENEIALYENNIGFFGKSANAAAMIQDILQKIENAKKYIVELKQKLDTIDKMDKES